MPVKKGGKKNKKIAGKSDMRPMPSLVINNIRLTADNEIKESADQDQPMITRPTEPTPSKPIVNIREKFLSEQGAREKKISVWLWVGMVVIIAVIVAFWSYSIYYSVTTINWKKTEEGKLINKTTTDWEQIFKEREMELQKEQALKNIKTILNQAMVQSTISTTTLATSTTSTISTTTIISTTTNR